jgi:hypothetical protein
MTVNSTTGYLDVIMNNARAWAATFLLFPLPSSLAEAEQRQARSHARRSVQVGDCRSCKAVNLLGEHDRLCH